MLIKTIVMETQDDTLFSKSAALLTAATELCYHTVNCSALNAEELRREKGIEVSSNCLLFITTGCARALKSPTSYEQLMWHCAPDSAEADRWTDTLTCSNLRIMKYRFICSFYK